NNLRRSDPSRCASEQPFAVHRQVVPSFQMVVSSQFPIGTRRRILNGEERSTQLLSRGARAIHTKGNAGRPARMLRHYRPPWRRQQHQTHDIRAFIEQTTRQLELTITPPHASSSDGATHPGGAWNRRLRSLLASAPQASDSACPFPGNRE